MILLVRILAPDSKEVASFLLHPKTFRDDRMGWEGQGKLELDGGHYPALCQLVTTGEAANEVEAGPADGP